MEKEDKILKLIQKMYNEFNNRFDKVEGEIKKNRETITRIENKMDNKLGALFDGHKLHHDKLDEISNNVNDINHTLSQHDLKIKSMDNVKEDNQNNEY